MRGRSGRADGAGDHGRHERRRESRQPERRGRGPAANDVGDQPEPAGPPARPAGRARPSGQTSARSSTSRVGPSPSSVAATCEAAALRRRPPRSPGPRRRTSTVHQTITRPITTTPTKLLRRQRRTARRRPTTSTTMKVEGACPWGAGGQQRHHRAEGHQDPEHPGRDRDVAHQHPPTRGSWLRRASRRTTSSRVRGPFHGTTGQPAPPGSPAAGDGRAAASATPATRSPRRRRATPGARVRRQRVDHHHGQTTADQPDRRVGRPARRASG